MSSIGWADYHDKTANIQTEILTQEIDRYYNPEYLIFQKEIFCIPRGGGRGDKENLLAPVRLRQSRKINKSVGGEV